jgi:hypothetical protein
VRRDTEPAANSSEERPRSFGREDARWEAVEVPPADGAEVEGYAVGDEGQRRDRLAVPGVRADGLTPDGDEEARFWSHFGEVALMSPRLAGVEVDDDDPIAAFRRRSR